MYPPPRRERIGTAHREAELEPLFAVLAPLNAEILAADRRIAAFEKADPIIALLATAPSVGPLTASAVVATIDDVTRFHSAHQFEAFLGLVPGERSSGEKRRVGRITKAGNSRAVRSFALPNFAETTASHLRARTEG